MIQRNRPESDARRLTYTHAGRDNHRVAPTLSNREIEVLRAWFMCNSKSETASQLHIALGTLNTHLARIRAKYHAVGRPAQTKAALVARAVQDGIVNLDEL
ncbi:LuxR C-terminal-related transcriptional regulator [Hoyosella sp. YIM 151337]|uniref:LuxR C-terminal-related transcriptional regulator n=1 Tax=Hoyosella sp. YIM 151337 TaxID=2992742 RepID=UPI0035A87515